MAFRKTRKIEILVDHEGNHWTRVYRVYLKEGSYSSWWPKESDIDYDRALVKAKKYIHLGNVKIVEEHTRAVNYLSMQGVCT